MLGLRSSLLGALVVCILWPAAVIAQTFACPSGPGPGEVQVGMSGGSGGVAPIPVCASDGSEDSSGSNDTGHDGPVWETRWGAIARGDGGGWGAVGDMLSERSAKKAALKQCEKTASMKRAGCKVSITYYNQCVAYSWGSRGGVSSSAIDVQTASDRALKLCGNSSNDCEVLYSNCSYPKQLN